MKTRKSSAVNSKTESLLTEAERRLRREYGQPRHHNPTDPLDDLVFLVLSRMTQEVKYVRTYEAIREALPSWELVMDAPHESVEDLIRDAGLAPTKTRQLREMLREIERREEKLDLARLREMSDPEVQDYLTSLPGVSAKTARCVMLYALGRDVCPVDTHVWRVMHRLGLGAEGAWTERRALAVEAQIPPGIRASLHVTFVAHGRATCLARRPRCGECVLEDLCPRKGGEARTE